MPEQNTTAVAQKRDLTSLYTPGAILIAGALIGLGLFLGLSNSGSNAAGGEAPQVAVNIEDVDLSNDPYIGQQNAPVVIAYWSDYQCPFCKAVEMGHPDIPIEPALPKVIEEYVNSGKVRISFQDYPFLSEDSMTAALYGRAVWALYPDKFWEWREAMYEAQDEEHGGFGDEASIVALMRGVSGIDADRVKADVAANTDAYTQLINADKAEGESFGIRGTPGFIIGKTLIPGASDFSEFKAAIDGQL